MHDQCLPLVTNAAGARRSILNIGMPTRGDKASDAAAGYGCKFALPECASIVMTSTDTATIAASATRSAVLILLSLPFMIRFLFACAGRFCRLWACELAGTAIRDAAKGPHARGTSTD
jgi:hypothetical protein